MISDRELLDVWDAAQEIHPAARPLVLLRAAGDGATETLPIPARDRRLLALRERWFGSAYESVVTCDACGTAIELTFDGSAVALIDAPETARRIGDVEYRLPDTRDLVAISRCATVDAAKRMLVERCIVGTVTDEAREAVAAALEAEDDLRIAVTCPECNASWDVVFDPGAYLWNEVDAAAMRVFREVDALAAAYGWTEGEILDLSPRRRALYLRMVTL
ncbi:MAG: hypothetical protein M3Q69_00715 [Acidobacteriota bacterium]|nr:hypothetical protein [Acidobacteriota bacterium]